MVSLGGVGCCQGSPGIAQLLKRTWSQRFGEREAHEVIRETLECWGWVYEMCWDGEEAQVGKKGGDVSMQGVTGVRMV